MGTEYRIKGKRLAQVLEERGYTLLQQCLFGTQYRGVAIGGKGGGDLLPNKDDIPDGYPWVEKKSDAYTGDGFGDLEGGKLPERCAFIYNSEKLELCGEGEPYMEGVHSELVKLITQTGGYVKGEKPGFLSRLWPRRRK